MFRLKPKAEEMMELNFKNHPMKVGLIFALVIMSFLGCQNSSNTESNTAPSLYEAYEDAFMIGTALNKAQILSDYPELLVDTVRQDLRGYFVERRIIGDKTGLELTKKHFKAITPENVMKWEEIHPLPGVYDFEAADKFVDFAEQNNKFISAHTLIWHSQTPDWVFVDENNEPLTREALLERMRDHIHTIVGRYKGRIDGWDVINEAFNQDGTFRESKWYNIIGDDFLAKAFEFAREADPDVELYYNDYSMENPAKRAGIIREVKKMMDAGVPITGIGSQSHLRISSLPTPEETDAMISDLAELGIDVMITELDINMLPGYRNADGSINENRNIYPDGLTEEAQEQLTKAYVDLFSVYLDHKDTIKRVTLWGVSDAGSWLNYFPAGLVNHPLLFDYDNEPKPVFDALIELVQNQ